VRILGAWIEIRKFTAEDTAAFFAYVDGLGQGDQWSRFHGGGVTRCAVLGLAERDWVIARDAGGMIVGEAGLGTVGVHGLATDAGVSVADGFRLGGLGLELLAEAAWRAGGRGVTHADAVVWADHWLGARLEAAGAERVSTDSYEPTWRLSLEVIERAWAARVAEIVTALGALGERHILRSSLGGDGLVVELDASALRRRANAWWARVALQQRLRRTYRTPTKVTVNNRSSKDGA
jgi:hypothetical protein